MQAHLSPNSKFDFHKYIKRSLEDDFKVVVGIRFLFSFVNTIYVFNYTFIVYYVNVMLAIQRL
jgi:mlo protein